jgi:hypothetical protein
MTSNPNLPIAWLVSMARRLGVGRRRPLADGRPPQQTHDTVDRPAQVHRGRTGGEESTRRGIQIRITSIGAHRQGEPVGRGDADQGRAAYVHVADGMGRILERD